MDALQLSLQLQLKYYSDLHCICIFFLINELQLLVGRTEHFSMWFALKTLVVTITLIKTCHTLGMQEVQAFQLSNRCPTSKMYLSKSDSLLRVAITLFPPPVCKKVQFTAHYMHPIHVTVKQFWMLGLQAVSLYC